MILRTIGQGGMGAVYKVQDIKRQSICAIKEMSLSMVPAEEQAKAVQNFKAEAQMLADLKHINLPTVTGYFTEGQRHFLVMEYIEGITLDEYLGRNAVPFPERRVLGWARQLCDVLAYLHSQQPPIIFRDMKPGNIMLMHNGRIKLIDFGIARFFRHASSQDTQLLGTPGFAPPEQYGKAQTDERSDIYSLAMTLFQLMTSTLSEKGFGLRNIHASNPEISLLVARALEKATALSPEDRFQSVDAFRRALLGEGTFIFESGDQATSAEELAELCARFPQEAVEYLDTGEIESWLLEIGNTELARAAQSIRIQENDPEVAVDLFLQQVLGPSIRIRHRTGSAAPSHAPAFRNGRAWPPQKPLPHTDNAGITVQPRTLDFGEVYPGLSEAAVLSITGDRGSFVQGTLAATEPWIVIDRTSFDGVLSRVNVQVDTVRLRGSTHYTGAILVIPDEDDDEQDITVRVEVDVLGRVGTNASTMVNGQSRRGLSPGAFRSEDDEDDDDARTISSKGMTMTPPTKSPVVGSRLIAPAPAEDDVGSAHAGGVQAPQYSTRYRKRGGGGGNSSATGGRNAAQPTLLQSPWVRWGITVFAALILASLSYILLSVMLSVSPAALLPPKPSFILVLLGMVPAATLGALVINWSRRWRLHNILNRLCTGLSTVLFALGCSDFLWQTAFHANAPVLQLIVMLLMAALGAALGTHPEVSERLLTALIWAMVHVRRLVISVILAIGVMLGIALTVGIALSWLTPLSILAGAAVTWVLVLRVERLIKKPY